MEKVWVLLLKDFKLGDKTYKEGDLIEVDKEVADVLIEKEVAKAKTREEHIADGIAQGEKDALAAREAEEAAEKEKLEKAVVTDVHERLADDPTGGYICFADFAKEVSIAGTANRAVPKRLVSWQQAWDSAQKTKTSMMERDDEQGGYTVPTQFIPRLLKLTQEASIVRSRSTFVPMQTNRVSLPAINETTHAGGVLFGGVLIYRPGEGKSKTPSKPGFGLVSLTLHKLVGLVYVTDELLEDSPISMEPLLTDMFGQAIAFTEDDDFITSGTGVNSALSVLSAVAPVGCTIPQARQLAGTITGLDIVRMVSRLYAPSLANAVWLFNNDALPAVMTASYIPAGTIVPVPLFIASGWGNKPVRGLVGTLFGRPAIMTEKCQTLGTMGDIMLCDFAQYLIGGKAAGGQPKMTTSIHLRFLEDETAFRYVMRYDGQPWWRTPLTPRHSIVTVSPFVVLSDTTILTTTTPGPTTTTGTTTEAPTTTTL